MAVHNLAGRNHPRFINICANDLYLGVISVMGMAKGIFVK